MSKGIKSLTGSEFTTFVVMVDDCVGEHVYENRAQLRSIPYLKEFGFDRVIHDDLWDNDFRLVDYELLNPDDVDAETVEFPLIHITNQKNLVERGEQHLVRGLLRERSRDDPYILVVDTDSPSTPAYTTRKSVRDEFVPNTVTRFERSVEDYIDEYLNSTLPTADTRNLYYHRISHHHNEVGAPAGSFLDLFDYDKAPPNSPAWEPLYYFVNHDLEQILEKYTERIREALRSWTERGDVMKIANNMDSMLTRCQFSEEQLDEQRDRNAGLYPNV